ncbi:hypothetical protein CVIRNUC_006696 [Coccomyxa viridis]|uniref:Tetratricopeptide SHNi-TPR domain-containing protein n=1 Tax=Coccomyxa viridis TaxID=1274662 RepID=A0AAV1I8S9_9CHLO|nr:hypothetical protein CVIRNUC_006696 [Coccomyxa viridis]
MATGPSSSSGPSSERIAEANATYDEGMASLRANDLDKAVELLGAALQTRIQAYGELASDCATAYHHYGTAIFYKAQEEQDVFGAPLQQAAEEQENDVEEPKEKVSLRDANKENVYEKGKAPLLTANEEDTGEGDDAEDDDDEDDANEGDAGDMQLAWEMLEVARSIYSKMGDEKALALADVHVLLGDIGMEEERFESSASDYEEALKLLAHKLEGDDRRIAEAHYKMALTLQFLEDPERALEHANKATAVCRARISRLSAAPLGADAAVEDPADAAAKETEDLKAVLEDLAAKVEDLEAAVREKESTKKALRDAFSQVAGSYSGSDASSLSASRPPTGPTASAVVNLGVVGRGNKRINLQPVTAASGAPAGANAAGPAAAAARKPKRSFEDIMGGGAASSLGFGGAVAVPQGFGAPAGSTSCAPPAGNFPVLKAPDVEVSAAASVDAAAGHAEAAEGSAAPGASNSVPAFLQASQLAKIYGRETAQPPTTQG